MRSALRILSTCEPRRNTSMPEDSPTSDAKKVECPSCRKLVEGQHEKCPHCGSPLSKLETSEIEPGAVFTPQSADLAKTSVISSTLSVQDGPAIELLTKLAEVAEKVNILWGERPYEKETPPALHFPEHVERITPREVMKIIEDIQKCYTHEIPNACPGLLRKALASAIKIKFYKNKQRDMLYDTEGNRKGDILDWINMAKQQGYLSQELAKQLKRAKIFGDIGVHDERIDFDEAEVAEIFQLVRYAIEDMYKTD
jgi:endogenous inhibitor of DNA gyrase (YacG/DUF329 family)